MQALNSAKLSKINLITTNEQALTFSQLMGTPLILFFYPKDNTPGCTQSVKDFRDFYPSFQKHHANILGVSRDSLQSHLKFKQKHQLPFDLISDSDEELCELYQVIKNKNMFGKQVRGIVRSTFLYDANGTLCKSWTKVKVPGHTEEVYHALTAMLTS